MTSHTVPVQIAFRSNPARYSFAGNSRLINAYVEQDGSDAKKPLAVLPCPGMVACCTVTDTPNRGNIFLDDLACGYVVHASGVYKYVKTSDSPFTLSATRIGTVPGTDQVQMNRNQASPVQVSIHCAAGEFYIEADIVKTVAASSFTSSPVTSENVKGYTLYGEADGKFFFSSINQCQTIDPLDFATAEQYADKLTRIKALGSDVYFFSHTSIEPWRVTSDLNLPFQVIGGAVSTKGMVAANSPVNCDNTLMFPGEDNIFYRMNGYNPTRISTHGIERYLEGDTTRESIQGLSYSFEGHSFANWTSPSGYSVSYDAATQFWHERRSKGLTYWRACNAVRAFGKTIVGDSQSGKLFYLDKDTYTEDSGTMVWGIDTPFLHVFPNGGIVDALHIDIATGVGTTLATDQGYDPILMLSWSTDGGKTFRGHRQIKLGKVGNNNRGIARRIGRFGDKGIQFRLRISDPVIRAVVEMGANIRPLKK